MKHTFSITLHRVTLVLIVISLFSPPAVTHSSAFTIESGSNLPASILASTSGMTSRVSIATNGAQANDYSDTPRISADGHFVVFDSGASNLVSGDTNGTDDIFVRDLQTGTTIRVSVATNGAQGNGVVDRPAISADGRYVVFKSRSDNLANGDTNGVDDIFVRDLQNGMTTRVSVATDGTQGNDYSDEPAISADGSYVVFESWASNFVNGDTNGGTDVFLRDVQTGQTSLISVGVGGIVGNGGSYWSSISADGRYVAFVSNASNLVGGDTNGQPDVFLRDLQTGTTIRVSVATNGAQGNNLSDRTSVSADGRYVAFASNASNLVSGDTNGQGDVFVRDLPAGTTTRVSVATDGTQGNDFSDRPFISADGRYVVFESWANNLISGDANGQPDVFLRDLQTGTTTRISVATNGTEGNGSSYWASISADGRFVTFASGASNLVTDDTNGAYDVFVNDRGNGTSVSPFLDLPVQYTQFSVSANGNFAGQNSGRVNSWFDHNVGGQTVTTWTGNTYTGAGQTSAKTCNRISCYDGHNGIDFQNAVTNEQVFAASSGTVFGVVSNCQNATTGCTGYGNRVWVDHANGYATLYGHLASVSMTNGTLITNPHLQPLGIMGSTGNSSGTHLHFGLYYDQNGDGQWTENEAVDPYGWLGTLPDPWGLPSTYLWIHALNNQDNPDASGGAYSTPSGSKSVVIPPGALDSSVTLEMWDTPPVAEPSAQLRSTGDSFWMRILDWLTGGSSLSARLASSANGFNTPITVNINFDPSAIRHLNVAQLTIQQWDESGQVWIPLTTSIDTRNHQASAETTRPGYFDLQGPLLCPDDTLEPNDHYDASNALTNRTLVYSLFDIAQDEDWFQFDAIANRSYNVGTTNLSAGADTILEIYDRDGVSLLASDNNSGGGKASLITWQAPSNGVYFVRVKRATGGAYGCTSSYEMVISAIVQSYGADTTGVFRPSNGLLYLKNTNDTGIADIALNYGLPGDYPVVGDWDGNGTVTIGVYRNGYFYLRNENTIGFAEVVFPFGVPGDQPIAGDWDGDGVDTIGVFRPSNAEFMLRNSNTEGPAEMDFFLGNPGDVGIAGDWNGDGFETTGVFRPSNGVIFLKDTNDTGFADYALNYGLPGDKPVMGDWDNDGIDTIGIYRNGTFYLRNENTNGFATIVFGLGNPGDMPIAGNWDGMP